MCKHSDFIICILPMEKEVVVQNEWSIGAGGDPRKISWGPSYKKPYIPLS